MTPEIAPASWDPQAPSGLVLLNMGGPDTLADVRPYLQNLFADRDLIQLPLGAVLQKPFAHLIARRRAPKAEAHYREIGGSSPQLYWTRRQAEDIAAALGPHWQPQVAMRYWGPGAADALQALRQQGVQQAVVLSMYPHYTQATTGSSVKDFRRHASTEFPQLQYSLIESWYNWPGYIQSLANRVQEGLQEFAGGQPPQIVFSAHALPQKFIDKGDPYLDHVLETVKGVMQQLGNYTWHLSFQSRSGPVRWMEPDTLDVLSRLGREGERRVLLVPVSFVSDHIETLHEVDIEMAEHARTAGIETFVRSPSLNDHADFTAAMASLVQERLGLSTGTQEAGG